MNAARSTWWVAWVTVLACGGNPAEKNRDDGARGGAASTGGSATGGQGVGGTTGGSSASGGLASGGDATGGTGAESGMGGQAATAGAGGDAGLGGAGTGGAASCGNECPARGFDCCGEQCVNFKNDHKNCGTCGNACGGDTPSCINGVCAAEFACIQGVECAAPGSCCSSVCCTGGRICCTVAELELFFYCIEPEATCPLGCLPPRLCLPD